MKIGYVLKKFPKLSETFVLNEILALEEQGAEVVVFALSQPDETRFHAGVGRLRAEIRYVGSGKSADFARKLAEHRVPFTQAGRSSWDATWDLLAGIERDPIRQVRAALEVACLAYDEGVDRLHAHFAGTATDVARAAASLVGVPYSFTCHAKDIYHESVDLAHLTAQIDHAERVITVCDANRRHLEERIGRQIPQLERLYNGIDISRFHPRNRRPSSRPMILGIGRLVEKKGFLHLVHSMDEMVRRGRDVHCVIAGEGRERAAIEREILARGLGAHVQLIGAVDQDHVKDLLEVATVLALPCVIGEDGNRDALPTVILEAMAAGVPVVSTPVAGVEEMLDEGRAGILVPCADPGAMARALATLLDEPSTRNRFARAARRRVENEFDLRKSSARLLAGFEPTRETAIAEGSR